MQEASIRQGQTATTHPVDNLRRRFHTRPAALKKQMQDLLQTHLGLQHRQQCRHKGPQHILRKPCANRHDRLLAEVSIRPLPSHPQGRDVLGAVGVLRVGRLEFLFQSRQVALSLLQAFAMPFGFGFSYLVLLHLDGLGLLVRPLASRLRRCTVDQTRLLRGFAFGDPG